jgi:hypothetical protein
MESPDFHGPQYGDIRDVLEPELAIEVTKMVETNKSFLEEYELVEKKLEVADLIIFLKNALVATIKGFINMRIDQITSRNPQEIWDYLIGIFFRDIQIKKSHFKGCTAIEIMKRCLFALHKMGIDGTMGVREINFENLISFYYGVCLIEHIFKKNAFDPNYHKVLTFIKEGFEMDLKDTAKTTSFFIRVNGLMKILLGEK